MSHPLRYLPVTLCLLSSLLLAAGQDINETLAQTAVEAERQGDFASAVSAFEELLRNGADTPDLRSNLGIAYYQLHRFSNALREFRLALAKSPDSVPANLFSGLSLVKLEHPKEALPYLERAHRMQPEASEIVLALAQAEVASNDIRRARVWYEQATRLNPRNAEGWYGLGITDRALAEYEVEKAKHDEKVGNTSAIEASQARAFMHDSEETMAKAMQLDPDSVHAHMILGESFRIAEQYKGAVQQYQMATTEQPNLAQAWIGLARVYLAAGDSDNALKAASHALSLDPNDADSNALMAGTLLRQGDYSKAKPYALSALKLQPDLTSAHIVLAKIYLAQEEPEKALSDLQAAARDDTDGSTYYLLAATLRQLGKPTEAESALQKYKQLHRARVSSASNSR